MLDVSLRKRNKIVLNSKSSGCETKNTIIKRYRKRLSDDVTFYGLFVVIGFFIIILIGTTIFDEPSTNRKEKICTYFYAFIPLYVYVLLFILGASILYFHLKPIEDGYGLQKDILKNICSFIFFFVCHILWHTVSNGIHNVWGHYIWLSTSLISGHVITIFIPIVRSYKKRASDIESRGVRFSKVLQDVVLFEKYKICAASFFCTELILFIEGYQHLKKTVVKYYEKSAKNQISVADNLNLSSNIDLTPQRSRTPSQSRDKKMKITPVTVSIHDTLIEFLDSPPPADEKIPRSLRPHFLKFYRTFLDPSADLAINVIDSTIRDVTTKIDANDYKLNMFEITRAEVLHLLYGNTFHSFEENYKEIIQSRLKI